MKFDFNNRPITSPIWKSDSKKEKLRKYVHNVKQFLKFNDIKNVNKTLTNIEELYNANN